jgi:hypothetical protein
MTGNGRKQIENLIEKIESIYQEWENLVTEWAKTEIGELPSLPKMVETQLMHLRGLDAKKASEYEWMLIV